MDILGTITHTHFSSLHSERQRKSFNVSRLRTHLRTVPASSEDFLVVSADPLKHKQMNSEFLPYILNINLLFVYCPRRYLNPLTLDCSGVARILWMPYGVRTEREEQSLLTLERHT